MQYIATKNQNKKEDKHPDFRIYKRDSGGEIIKEEYEKKDGTTGTGWKPFGAIWCKIENNKIKSMSINIDDENGAETPKISPQQAEDNYPKEDINPEDIPF